METLLEPVRNLVDTQLFVSAHVLIIGVHVILLGVAYLVYLERKISSYIQDRIGPNRVGFDFGLPFLKFLSTDGPLKGLWGLGQPLADGVKFLLKEDYTPTKADKALFTLAPVVIIIPALIGFAVIPWGGVWMVPPIGDVPIVGPIGEWIFGPIGGEEVLVAGANINIGVVYLLAVGSLGVYGVTLGGWASNSKYSFLGGMRATAQMISYEIPMGLSLLAVLLLAGTLLPQAIIEHQVENGWMMITQPLACVLFFICALAEANRAPFDNAEAEQELVGGYHTEYSSMRFALFFLAEYAHMVTGAAFFVLLFMGGYHLPLGWLGFGAEHLLSPENTTLAGMLAKVLVFGGKVALINCFQMVIRWTLPRLRYDQVMMLGWQTLIPVSLGVVVVTSVMVAFGWTGIGHMLLANVVVIGLVYLFQTTLPRSTANTRTRLYGSRFYPAAGTIAQTAPTDPTALEDRPIEGTTGEPAQPAMG
ncbi:MAG: complex I subunit 1 family protein [Planctomycetota bacterium]